MEQQTHTDIPGRDASHRTKRNVFTRGVSCSNEVVNGCAWCISCDQGHIGAYSKFHQASLLVKIILTGWLTAKKHKLNFPPHLHCWTWLGLRAHEGMLEQRSQN
eukprot:6457809-Amphidinium_carterae.1